MTQGLSCNLHDSNFVLPKGKGKVKYVERVFYSDSKGVQVSADLPTI